MATSFPAEWNDADILDGLDIEDKSKLLGVPFLITGCQFKLSNDNVNICYVDGKYADGQEFTFTDASTGVRAQLIAYLTERKLDAVVDSGEYQAFRLIVPNGLRVSEYEVTRQGSRHDGWPAGSRAAGKTMAKTYYLTTSGRREGRAEAQKAQKRTATSAK